MTRVFGFTLLFFAMCIAAAWAIFASFPLHVLAALVAVGLAFAAFIGALLALAHLTSNSGGL